MTHEVVSAMEVSTTPPSGDNRLFSYARHLRNAFTTGFFGQFGFALLTASGK